MSFSFSSSSYSLCSIFFRRIFWSTFLLRLLYSLSDMHAFSQYVRSSSYRSCFDRLGRSSRFDIYDLLLFHSTFLLFLTYSWLITTFWFWKYLNAASWISSSNSCTRNLLCYVPFHCALLLLCTSPASKAGFSASHSSSPLFVFLSLLQFSLSNLRFLLLLLHF